MDVISFVKAKKAQAKADSVQTQLNQAIAAGDQLAETQQARVDVDSKTYTTLKQRLDFEQTQLKNALDLTKGMDRQSQVLQHGLSVINGEVGSPLDVEIQGRTLASLGNSVLEDTKKYVISDKKFKVKFADNTTYSGVGKFQGKNERPTIIRIANFEDKVPGSNVENPHVAKYNENSSLLTPSTFGGSEYSSSHYGAVNSLNGTVFTRSTSVNGQRAMHLQSFDIIVEIERQVGRIPRTTVADKVQWIKNNVARFTCNWHGNGSSVGGNKATLQAWNVTASAWATFFSSASSHTSGAVSKLFQTFNTAGHMTAGIDNNGFANLLAYAEPSDGVIASTINTDYVELEIELKPDADFTHPSVPLYEVTQAEYDNILVAWNEATVVNRYPRVQGIQHLQNPAVIAEGENLLPPFTEWTLNANARVISPYELELNATAGGNFSTIDVNVVGNQMYHLYLDYIGNGRSLIRMYDSKSTMIYESSYNYSNSAKITAPANAQRMRIIIDSAVSGKFTFINPTLNLGSTAKSFVPRNPSYLYAEAKLGQIGVTKDTLYKQDGQWYARKRIEKDVVLDGSLSWAFSVDKAGYKQISQVLTTPFITATRDSTTFKAIKYDGKLLTITNWGGGVTTSDIFYPWSSGKDFELSISDTDSGWGESQTPTANDIKRYMNGWKYTDGTTWQSITGNGQTATNQQALDTKPSDYTPYKLSYVLATPQTINVSDKVEGDLAINGLTQVEVTSGVVVKEKVTPHYSSSDDVYHINYRTSPSSHLKNKTALIFSVQKNSVKNSTWVVRTNDSVNSNGTSRAFVAAKDFDPTAEYTVTYLVLDRHQFTSNATEVKATYAKNIRSALDDAIARQADIGTTVSVNTRAIVDLYARVKSLEGRI